MPVCARYSSDLVAIAEEDEPERAQYAHGNVRVAAAHGKDVGIQMSDMSGRVLDATSLIIGQALGRGEDLQSAQGIQPVVAADRAVARRPNTAEETGDDMIHNRMDLDPLLGR